MNRITHAAIRFLKAQDGPTAVEYAVMLALIIVAVIGAVTTVGSGSSGTYTRVSNTIGGTGS
jgi:pilus assembly protein Flp/PilA